MKCYHYYEEMDKNNKYYSNFDCVCKYCGKKENFPSMWSLICYNESNKIIKNNA